MIRGIARDLPEPSTSCRAEALLEGYRERHARILDPADRTVPKEFVVFPEHRRWHGLGNDQLVLMYQVLVGVLTGRAVIGEPFAGVSDLYDLPIRLSAADLRRSLGIDLARVPGYAELVAPSSGDAYYPGWASPEAMACGDYADLVEPTYRSLDGGRLKVYDHTRGIPHLVFAAVNPRHRAFVHDHFGRHLVFHLARFLFRPSRPVAAAAAPVLERIRRQPTLGMHLRYGRGPLDLYTRRSSDTQLFWECAERLIGDPAQRGALFLATDSMRARVEARERFGDRLLHVDAPAMPDGATFEAVLDQALLTECDALVVTNRSTFGYVAHAQAGIVPYEVDGKHGRITARGDSQSGLYKHGRWEVERIWPWQRRTLEDCRCVARGQGAEIAGRVPPESPLAALRWLARIEGPGRVQRGAQWLARSPMSPASLLVPKGIRRAVGQRIWGKRAP